MFSVPNRPVLTLAVLCLTAIASSRSEAARDLAQVGSGLEIVVIEVAGCKYCPLFRQDVLPAYKATPRARDVPMRFVDVNAADASQLRFKSPIVTVPTAVLMRGSTEVGRIEGYVPPQDFARMITALLNP